MKVSDVGDRDCQVLAAFMQRLRAFRVPDTMMLAEIPEIADGVRWLQTLAIEMAKARAAPPPEPPAPPTDEKAGGLAGLTGVTVKEYHPGGKKK
jgi:hypothetical protein